MTITDGYLMQTALADYCRWQSTMSVAFFRNVTPVVMVDGRDRLRRQYHCRWSIDVSDDRMNSIALRRTFRIDDEDQSRIRSIIWTIYIFGTSKLTRSTWLIIAPSRLSPMLTISLPASDQLVTLVSTSSTSGICFSRLKLTSSVVSRVHSLNSSGNSANQLLLRFKILKLKKDKLVSG